MRIWILKAVVQKVISFLPFKHRINHFFQKYITQGIKLTPELFEDKVTHCGNHIAAYREYASLNEGFVALELGTGWYPIVPIGMFLCGASKVTTVDIDPLIQADYIRKAVNMFIEYEANGDLRGFLPDVDEERMSQLIALTKEWDGQNKEQLLAFFNTESVVGDARNLPFSDESIHLVTSNNTFEHIYPNILEEILQELVRVTTRGGVMSHFIDMSDHFSHLDSSINIYNFLKFSDERWSMIDNSIQPQNRLRITDYRRMYEELDIPIHTEKNREGDVKLVSNMKLADRFQGIIPEDLAISHSLVISQIS